MIDNFERALAVDPARSDSASILKGLQVVHDQWLAVLRREDVETIAPEPGEKFDPGKHEAIIHQPATESDEAGDDAETEDGEGETKSKKKKSRDPKVTQLLVKGYALHGRTLRPASVAVSQ